MSGVRIPIVAPEVGTAEMVLSAWYVYPGETVYSGDRVAEVLIPGATVDVCAPVDGMLVERCHLPEKRVHAGVVLGYLVPLSEESSASG